MKTEAENQLRLKSYLLGDLNAEERQRLEERLMTDSATFEELSWNEDELIDDYLGGILTRPEKEKFESYFLSAPERQRKLSFAKHLKRYVAEHESTAGSWTPGRSSRQSFWGIPVPVMQWALAASAILIIAGGSLSVLRITELQKAIKQAGIRESQGQLVMQIRNSELTTALAREQSRVRALEQEAANLGRSNMQNPSSRLPGQIQSARIALMTLDPGRLRDRGGSQEFHIPPGTDVAQLDLKMEPQDYQQYQLALKRVDGAEICTRIIPKAGSGAHGQPLRLPVFANDLRPDDYVLKLSGMTAGGHLEDIGKYYFRVTPK
jgi:hypothetical protein